MQTRDEASVAKPDAFVATIANQTINGKIDPAFVAFFRCILLTADEIDRRREDRNNRDTESCDMTNEK